MAKDYIEGIRLVNIGHVDAIKFNSDNNPYVSTGEILAENKVESRTLGQQYFLFENGRITVWSFLNGVSDNDLEKVAECLPLDGGTVTGDTIFKRDLAVGDSTEDDDRYIFLIPAGTNKTAKLLFGNDTNASAYIGVNVDNERIILIGGSGQDVLIVDTQSNKVTVNGLLLSANGFFSGDVELTDLTASKVEFKSNGSNEINFLSITNAIISALSDINLNLPAGKSLKINEGLEVIKTITANLGKFQTFTDARTNLGRIDDPVMDSTTNAISKMAALPVGYSSMMSNNITINQGAPEDGDYGYFMKIARRDSSSGWSGIWITRTTGRMYYGVVEDSLTLPTWIRVGSDIDVAQNTADILSIKPYVDNQSFIIGSSGAQDYTAGDSIELNGDIISRNIITSGSSFDVDAGYYELTIYGSMSSLTNIIAQISIDGDVQTITSTQSIEIDDDSGKLRILKTYFKTDGAGPLYNFQIILSGCIAELTVHINKLNDK